MPTADEQILSPARNLSERLGRKFTDSGLALFRRNPLAISFQIYRSLDFRKNPDALSEPLTNRGIVKLGL